MNVRTILASSAVLGLLATSDAAAQKLSLRVEQGLVTLEAENVTVDEVLARWSSLTGLSVVSKNGRGSDIPVSVHVAGIPEREALALVLRDLSGYIMGERRDPRTGMVTIDRVMILPDSAAQPSAAPPSVRVPAAPQPVFEIAAQPLTLPPDSNVDEPDDTDDRPRELAPAISGGSSGTSGAAGASGSPQLLTPFAVAPAGVVSDDNPAGLNSPTLRPGETVAAQAPPGPAPPTPTPSNPFAAPSAAQPGVIVPVPSTTPTAEQSPTPSLRVLPAAPGPQTDTPR